MADSLNFEDSVLEIGNQLRERVLQYNSEISLSTSYSNGRRDSSIDFSKFSPISFPDPHDFDWDLGFTSSQNDVKNLEFNMIDLSSTDPPGKLGKSIVHLLDCMAQIRTHSAKTNLLDTGAIEAAFGLIEVLNADKKRGGLERGNKVKEAACFALWSILEDFPEGQVACFR